MAAARYALKYPDRVARLVLDSVVPHDGLDPLMMDVYPRAAQVLRDSCVRLGCRTDYPWPTISPRWSAFATGVEMVDTGYSWRHRWYHTSVEKTTLYLPEDLKAAVKRIARQRGVPEAEIIRESIRLAVNSTNRPRPRGGLYAGTEPIARRVDDFLDGFGER